MVSEDTCWPMSQLEDEVSGANDYYQLGAIALRQRYEYEEAEEWLRQVRGGSTS